MSDIDGPDDSERAQQAGERGGGIIEIARTKVELWLVVIFMALAFGAGVTVMVMYEEPQPVAGFQQPVGQLPPAPVLTDEQLQGELPPDHPEFATGPTAGADQTAERTDEGGGAPAS